MESSGMELDPAPNSSYTNIAFHFKLPADGLALRSVRLNKDKPVLIFDASPKVPSIQEEDVATAFRLAAEGKRPGFFYTNFPFFHPLSHSRLFMQYSPAWLRWTGIGKLFAEVDWHMKCLHVGVRTDDEKTTFKSWPRYSQLQGLATHLDFPKDGLGPTIMSCDHATVQKSENELVFPEEPKMKITDECSSLYSKYITENYRSIAYHDEPRFLKMQEIVKLMLAVEWLYNEKGVRANQDWVMMHTSKEIKMSEDTQKELSTRKEPPYKMVPRPKVFKRPCSDVTVKTWEAEMYRKLKKDYGMERRYGFYDFAGTEMVMFKEDGTKCLTRKSLKFSFDHKGLESSKGYFYLPLPEGAEVPDFLAKMEDELHKLVPKCTQEVITHPLPVAFESKTDITLKGNKLKLTETDSYYPCPPLALPPLKETTTVTVGVDNYDKIFANMDPNTPIQPEIPGVCEAIIPDVKSWKELISELSVPLPRIWQAPFFGVGLPTAVGGVTTKSFPVREEVPRKKTVMEKSVWNGVYNRSGLTLMVQSVTKGTLRLLTSMSAEYIAVTKKFIESWKKGTPPSSSIFVFAVENSSLAENWADYRKKLKIQTSEEHYHGTSLSCDITASQTFCDNGCGICGISSAGMDPKRIRMNFDFQRFGHGFYLAPNSSKCHDYTEQNSRGFRAMLQCDVLPGRKYNLKHNNERLTGPPFGFDSVFGQVGSKLNYPEVVVYDKCAINPRYIIAYKSGA